MFCIKYDVKVDQKLYAHVPEVVLGNEKVKKILWNFNIQTHKEMEHQRPDVVVFVVDKEPMTCQIIEMAIPSDQYRLSDWSTRTTASVSSQF